MKTFVLTLTLALSSTVAMACPDGAKSMDAKSPTDQRLVIAEQPTWSQARSEAPKANPAKAAVKPTVASVAPAEAKKVPGG